MQGSMGRAGQVTARGAGSSAHLKERDRRRPGSWRLYSRFSFVPHRTRGTSARAERASGPVAVLWHHVQFFPRHSYYWRMTRRTLHSAGEDALLDCSCSTQQVDSLQRKAHATGQLLLLASCCSVLCLVTAQPACPLPGDGGGTPGTGQPEGHQMLPGPTRFCSRGTSPRLCRGRGGGRAHPSRRAQTSRGDGWLGGPDGQTCDLPQVEIHKPCFALVPFTWAEAARTDRTKPPAGGRPCVRVTQRHAHGARNKPARGAGSSPGCRDAPLREAPQPQSHPVQLEQGCSARRRAWLSLQSGRAPKGFFNFQMLLK
ncbi:uncharacterized protein [Struthio camelus]|uniref:uncharacterized protein n=1 Tax=Struthio camelus TaxID=8801 RepID=UPI0036041343